MIRPLAYWVANVGKIVWCNLYFQNTKRLVHSGIRHGRENDLQNSGAAEHGAEQPQPVLLHKLEPAAVLLHLPVQFHHSRRIIQYANSSGAVFGLIGTSARSSTERFKLFRLLLHILVSMDDDDKIDNTDVSQSRKLFSRFRFQRQW